MESKNSALKSLDSSTNPYFMTFKQIHIHQHHSELQANTSTSTPCLEPSWIYASICHTTPQDQSIPEPTIAYIVRFIWVYQIQLESGNISKNAPNMTLCQSFVYKNKGVICRLMRLSERQNRCFHGTPEIFSFLLFR